VENQDKVTRDKQEVIQLKLVHLNVNLLHLPCTRHSFIHLLKCIRADWPLTMQVKQIKSMLC